MGSLSMLETHVILSPTTSKVAVTFLPVVHQSACVPVLKFLFSTSHLL